MMQSLSDHKRYFMEMMGQFPYGVVIANLQRRIEWINRSFSDMCGYSLNELSGKRPAEILQGEKTNPVTSLELKEALDSGKRCHVEILNYHKDGHTYWADLYITPVYDRMGELDYYFAVTRDITEERMKREGMKDYLLELYQRMSETMGCPVPD